MKKKSKRKMKKVVKVNFLSPKFPSYLTSHTKPQNVRKYVAGKKRLACMDISPFHAWGKPKAIPKKNMTWPQAKIRFPKLKPMVDTDRDGVVNLLDCRPFNKRRQGWAHQGTMLYYPDSTTRVKMMKPEKFLRTTYKQTYDQEQKGREPKSMEEYSKGIINQLNVEKLKKVIRSRKGKMDIPYLSYDEQGRPTGHEGRHRAMAAQQLGTKLIPVSIVRKKKEKEGSEIKTIKQLDEYNKRKAKRMEIEDREETEHYSKQNIESADIPIQQQREYGEQKSEGLQYIEDEKDLYEKADEGTLTPKDIEEHELKSFNEDYDLKDEDDQTLDYEEEK